MAQNTDQPFKREVTASLLQVTENVGDLPKLLTVLVSLDVISVSEMELVESHSTTSEKLKALTLMFLRKPEADWKKFKQALVLSRNQHVAQQIDTILESEVRLAEQPVSRVAGEVQGYDLR